MADEFFILNEVVYVIMCVPEQYKSQSFWDTYSKKYRKPLKEMINDIKFHTLMNYGINLYGPSFKEECNQNLELSLDKLRSHHNLVEKILGKHTSYVDVVSECLDLLRTFQETTNGGALQRYTRDRANQIPKPLMVVIQYSG